MADTKVSALTADTTPTSDDLLYVVNDPGGAPGSKKSTTADVITKAHGLSNSTVVGVAGGVLTSGTDVAVVDGGTGASSASGARTNLGLVIGADVVAPNQDTTGKSAKTDALSSASTVVNVSAATAPSTGQVLTATDSTHATWQSPSGGSSTPRHSLSPDFIDPVVYNHSDNGGTGAVISFLPGEVHMQTGTTTTGSVAVMLGRAAFDFVSPIYNRNPQLLFAAGFDTFSAGQSWETNITVDFYGNPGGAPTGFTGFGFRFVNNNGTREIYSYVCDGSNPPVVTLLTGTGSSNFITCAAIMTSGSSIAYYVNGTLKDTQSTGLPTGSLAGSAVNVLHSKTLGTTNKVFNLYHLNFSYDAF